MLPYALFSSVDMSGRAVYTRSSLQTCTCRHLCRYFILVYCTNIQFMRLWSYARVVLRVF